MLAGPSPFIIESVTDLYDCFGGDTVVRGDQENGPALDCRNQTCHEEMRKIKDFRGNGIVPITISLEEPSARAISCFPT